MGRRVAEVRRARGLTQAELAEAAGVTTRYIQTIESGRQNLTLVSLFHVAAALRVAVLDLFVAPVSPPARRGRPSKSRADVD